jgi:hypothetical protein
MFSRRGFPGRQVRPLRQRRRAEAGPAVKTSIHEAHLGQHLQERPFPHRAGDSVAPGALAGRLLRRDAIFEQHIGDQESTTWFEHAVDFGQRLRLVWAQVE